MDIRTNWDSVRKEERENGGWVGSPSGAVGLALSWSEVCITFCHISEG